MTLTVLMSAATEMLVPAKVWAADQTWGAEGGLLEDSN